jgi:hypothetical protein
MDGAVTGLVLPRSIDDADAAFMTKVLRNSGVIAASNQVVYQHETGVGMTAGYFSSIKKVQCIYKDATDAQDSFVVKSWPLFELLPKESLEAIFMRDIKAYSLPAHNFYPRPQAYLAAFDAPNGGWILVMEDADTFGVHKVHENEMTLDEVRRMIPTLVDVAVAWEGCDRGGKAQQLTDFGVDLWASKANLSVFKAVMPGGAKLFDKLTTLEGSSLVGDRPWHTYLGGSGIAEMLTTRLDAFFEAADPRNGATCTLSHGDMKGDNIFFCEESERYPDGWLCIDFQLMFRGPVPSDLAYLMSSGSVLPDVYAGENLHGVLGSFYDQFMAKTKLYKDYRYDTFVSEFMMMTAVLFVYYVGMGAAIWQESALANARGARIELGGRGSTEDDLPPEELRQRMWWRKCIANFSAHFKEFGHYAYLQGLPENLQGLGEWTELPNHLR